jgi:hypothetical protein
MRRLMRRSLGHVDASDQERCVDRRRGGIELERSLERAKPVRYVEKPMQSSENSTLECTGSMVHVASVVAMVASSKCQN